MPKSPLLTLLASLLILTGCASGSGDRGFAMEPSEPVVRVGEQTTLKVEALEEIAQEPEWDIKEAYGGGFTSSRGLRVNYVAPATAGKYHVVVRSKRPDGSPIRTVLEVRVVPVMTVSPVAPRVQPGGGVDFNVRLKGLSNTNVHWKVEESGGGSIQSDGHYTAPDRPGIYHVTATAVADPETVGQAEISVE